MNLAFYLIILLYCIILILQTNVIKNKVLTNTVDKDEIMYNLAMKNCNTNTWSIHGLWPEWRYKSGWPQYCKNVTFSKKDLNSIIVSLNMKWYSCEESNVKFWIHEWFKHGSCTNFNELEYFRNGLKLYDYIIGYGLVNKCGTRSDNNCYAYFDKNFHFLYIK